MPAIIIRSATVAEVPPEPAIVYRPPPVAAETKIEPKTSLMESGRKEEAMAFVAEADRNVRVGEWEAALLAIAKAREILPEEAQLQLQYAFVLARLGREPEAADELTALLARKDIPMELRKEAIRNKNWIMQTISNMEQNGIAPAPRKSTSPSSADSQAANPSSNAGPVIEEIGLQPGASLGIVESREIEGTDDIKTLRIAIKNRPGMKIDSPETKVIVRFFEKNPTGEITLTESPVNSSWISPPVNWIDDEPEILDVIYPLAAAKKAKKNYHGYTVAVYFRNELQDTRAVPGELDQMFPSELFLESPQP